jgi:two-component system, NarL family, sensor kinase
MAAQPTAARAGRISSGVATRLAWGLGTVAIVVTLLAMALVLATRSAPRPGWERSWQLVLATIAWYLSFSIVGTIIAARRPANPVGWLLLGIGLTLGMNDFMHYYGTYTLIYRPGALPLGLAVGWVANWNWAIIFPLLPFVFLLFPDGRLPSRRWRPLAWAAGLCGGLMLLLTPFRARSLEYCPMIPNPVGFPVLTEAFFANLALVYFTLLLLATASLLVRFRTPAETYASS